MNDTIQSRVFRELDSFSIIAILNVVFGALAMAFGIQYMVSSVLGISGGQPLSLFRILTAAVSMAGFGLGLSWLLSSIEIMDGLDNIRTSVKDRKAQLPDEILTGVIVRMIAHYREHRKTIQTMILACTLGGFCFLALGIMSSIEFFSISLTTGTITMNSALLIPSALLTLAIAIVSLASSWYFSKFSKAWDLRQGEISLSEQELADELDRGSQ